MYKVYEAFVVMPDGREAAAFQPNLRYAVCASFQFGDAGLHPPMWLAVNWVKSKLEADEALRKLQKRRYKNKSYKHIETAIIRAHHRPYHR